MKTILILMCFFICFFQTANGETQSTEIIRLEVDGQKVKKNYGVFFRSIGELTESKKTCNGFIIPSELKNSEFFTILIKLGKYKFVFTEIHKSKFKVKWADYSTIVESISTAQVSYLTSDHLGSLRWSNKSGQEILYE